VNWKLYIALPTMLLSGSLLIPLGGATLKRVADQPESLTGQQLYASYCAVCHGADAKGGGPFAPRLKVWPPDLTQLARKNGGAFPSLHVAEVIDGEFQKPAHGSSEMPIWGPIFRSVAHGRNDSAQRRINRLVKYLESVQQK
jgi:mono/diheme cytochrome c family protein